ncbi:hypothetical protein [Listeria booriae]|uniref:hypothetical protein n=1 Tax=Listeria booriae TaxID=1552123 RepID=UPI001629EB73|nr:hypothetical protein [Listeria booriae]MBC1290859.1 hypothetical protein [Listeria booriae]
MEFTSEALYALNMLNDDTISIFNIPIPVYTEDERENLQIVLEKGYEDLEKMQLIIDDEPTEICSEYGYILKKYQKAKRYMILNSFTCAVDVDKNKMFSHVIEKTQDNQYTVERTIKMVLLAVFYQNIKLLQQLDTKKQSEDTKIWQDYALVRLQAFYNQNEAFNLQYYEYGKCTYSSLIIDNDSELIEYDLPRQKVRSIAGKTLKKQLVKFMKVQV